MLGFVRSFKQLLFRLHTIKCLATSQTWDELHYEIFTSTDAPSMSDEWLLIGLQGDRYMQDWRQVVVARPAGYSSVSVDKTELTSFD